jgi:hypothetical protein
VAWWHWRRRACCGWGAPGGAPAWCRPEPPLWCGSILMVGKIVVLCPQACPQLMTSDPLYRSRAGLLRARPHGMQVQDAGCTHSCSTSGGSCNGATCWQAVLLVLDTPPLVGPCYTQALPQLTRQSLACTARLLIAPSPSSCLPLSLAVLSGTGQHADCLMFGLCGFCRMVTQSRLWAKCQL